MGGFKNNRLSEDIMREIAAVIRTLKDPRVASSMISIVRCELSGDASHCKLYVSSILGIDKTKEACRGLDSAEGFIRRAVADKLHIRKCPELHFVADDSIEESARLNKIISAAVERDVSLHHDDDDAQKADESDGE